MFLEPGKLAAKAKKPVGRTEVERTRILETAATLEAAARTLKELAGTKPPKRPSNA